MGACALVCLIIGIAILVWWIRVRRAAKAVVGAFEDIDWESAITTIGDYPFEYPTGVMGLQTGSNMCVPNAGKEDDTFAFSTSETTKEDCLINCVAGLSMVWTAVNEQEDVCCMFMTNSALGGDACFGIPGSIQNGEGTDNIFFITDESEVYAISTKRGSQNPF